MVPRRFLTPGWIFGHVLVTAAVLLCLRLAWWQLARSHETDGGAQNFGYALLWPLFGAAFVYMWVKFLQLEQLRDTEIEAAHAQTVSQVLAEAEQLTAAASRDHTPFEQSAGILDSDHLGSEHLEPASESMAEQPAQAAPQIEDLYEQTHLNENEDAGLIAYNRALAALAEQDQRRAR